MKSMLISGANRGIGLELISQIVKLPSSAPQHLFAACRNPEKAEVRKSLSCSNEKKKNVNNRCFCYKTKNCY